MSAPSIIQMAAGVAADQAFTSNVTEGSFLFVIIEGIESSGGNKVFDNLNGDWTILETGDAQSIEPYTVAYLPSSLAGAVTVSTSSDSIAIFLVAEISACTLVGNSAMATGQVSGGDSSAVEFTSASIAATAGQLALGYAFMTGINIESAGGSYTLEAVGNPPVRLALETSDVLSSGNFNSDFISRNNVNSQVWGTGLLVLNAAYTISGNAGVAGATVSYSGTSSGTVIAGSGGAFSIAGLTPGTYTITPSLAEYGFSPTSQNVTITSANITGVNFTATEYLIEDWMWVTPFASQVDGVNDANLPMPYRVGFAGLVKMQVTYSIFLHNKGADSPGSNAHIWNNPNPGWQIAMVERQQAQTPGFAAIYASAPLLPNPVPPVNLPW